MKLIVRDSDGLVLMFGDGAPTPPEGARLVTLTEQQEAEFAALSKPNGGVTYASGAFAVLPYVTPAARDLSDADNLERALKAVLLAAAAMSGKTAAQARASFTTAWRALP